MWGVWSESGATGSTTQPLCGLRASKQLKRLKLQQAFVDDSPSVSLGLYSFFNNRELVDQQMKS